MKKESTLLDPGSRDFVYDEVDEYEDERDRLSLSRAHALMARPRPQRVHILSLFSHTFPVYTFFFSSI